MFLVLVPWEVARFVVYPALSIFIVHVLYCLFTLELPKKDPLGKCVQYKNICIHTAEDKESCPYKDNCEFVRPSYIICDKKCSNKDHLN